ncbi:stage V sporulation protein AE [Clostridium sp. UBA4548]|uniref:stage V sporulation protein AE n=1 Tax=Clostridium sp. UBA4548 TaxID=1946361 RepID=UPI0039C87ACA
MINIGEYLRVFLVGGIICVIAQVLMDTTKLTPARILVIFVTAGVILQGFGIYEKIVEVGKSGATVPLPGFGYSLAKGVMKEVDDSGIIGVFTGGVKGTAGGITVAIVFGYIMSLCFNSKTK